jgi:hypothetical protein
MLPLLSPLTYLLVLVLALAAPTQDLSPERIDDSIAKGVQYLLGLQTPDGSWQGLQFEHYRGMTALVLYTLIKCGLPESHPAVATGFAWLDAQSFTKTYDLGVVLMAYESLKSPPIPRMKVLAEQLVRTMGNGGRTVGGRWGYPNDHGGNNADWSDLSNTQYAVLGLRSAMRAGIKVGSTDFWTRIADDLISDQDHYGGFPYRPGERVSAAMTVAGVTVLIVCSEALVGSQHSGIQGRLRVGMNRSFMWLDEHFTVDRAVDFRMEGNAHPDWLFYYLYGLERVCSFTDRNQIGTHDWHSKGAVRLISSQNDKGAWGRGDTDTCFALLFLRRGSRSSGLGPRSQALFKAGEDAAFAIGTNQAAPLIAWFRKVNAPMKEILAAGANPEAVLWEMNGKIVQRIPVNVGTDLLGEATFFRCTFENNGTHTIQAKVELDNGKTLLSNVLTHVVDDIEEAWQREARRDIGKNLVQTVEMQVEATSSTGGGQDAKWAVDGRHASAWLCGRDDAKPSISLTFLSQVRASQLKVTSASPYAGNERGWARPKDIRIRVNGGKPQSVRLADDVRNKQSIPFPGTVSLRNLQIEIVSVYPGQGNEHRAAGFREIELYRDVHPEDRNVSSGIPTYLWPLAHQGGSVWRYSLEKPAETWADPSFKDLNWKKGEAGFGDGEVPGAVIRTPWKGKELWARREFRLGAGAIPTMTIEIHQDDDADIYLNGVLAVASKGHTPGGYRTWTLSDRAREALVPGRNVVAVHMKNTGGVGYFDMALVTFESR